MKILFFTDTHYHDKKPSSRIDDYIKSQYNKTLEIFDIAKKEKVDYIIHGGDLFDIPNPRVKVVTKYGQLFQKQNIPIYVISGNHDVYGYNKDSIDSTMLGLLKDFDIVKLLDKHDSVIIEKENVKVGICPRPYHSRIDSENKKDYFPERMDVDHQILVIHSMLMDKPYLKEVEHTTIDQIISTNCDIVLSGHYHIGFGIVRKNNKFFINPGSLMRMTNSFDEIKRKPKVVIIELTKNDKKAKEIELKTALPGDEVLTRDNKDIKKIQEQELLEFSQIIRNNLNLKTYNYEKIIKQISEDENFSKEVLDQAMEAIDNIRKRRI